MILPAVLGISCSKRQGDWERNWLASGLEKTSRHLNSSMSPFGTLSPIASMAWIKTRSLWIFASWRYGSKDIGRGNR